MNETSNVMEGSNDIRLITSARGSAPSTILSHLAVRALDPSTKGSCQVVELSLTHRGLITLATSFTHSAVAQQRSCASPGEATRRNRGRNREQRMNRKKTLD